MVQNILLAYLTFMPVQEARFDTPSSEQLARTRIAKAVQFLTPVCPLNTFNDDPLEFTAWDDAIQTLNGAAMWMLIPRGAITELSFGFADKPMYPRVYDRKSFLSDLVSIMGNNSGEYLLSSDLVRKEKIKDGVVVEWIKGEYYFGSNKVDSSFLAKIVDGDKLSTVFSTPALNTALVGRVKTLSSDELLFRSANFIANHRGVSTFALTTSQPPELRWGAPDLSATQKTYEHGQILTSPSQAQELMSRVAIPYRQYSFNLSSRIATVMVDARDGSIFNYGDYLVQDAFGGRASTMKPSASNLTPIRTRKGETGKIVSAPKNGQFVQHMWMQLGLQLVRGKFDPKLGIWSGKLADGKTVYIRLTHK
jgi:hypothetical protein